MAVNIIGEGCAAHMLLEGHAELVKSRARLAELDGEIESAGKALDKALAGVKSGGALDKAIDNVRRISEAYEARQAALNERNRVEREHAEWERKREMDVYRRAPLPPEPPTGDTVEIPPEPQLRTEGDRDRDAETARKFVADMSPAVEAARLYRELVAERDGLRLRVAEICAAMPDRMAAAKEDLARHDAQRADLETKRRLELARLEDQRAENSGRIAQLKKLLGMKS